MATSDPWASLFLNAAGEAPPESKADKILSKVEQINSSLAINDFLYSNREGGDRKNGIRLVKISLINLNVFLILINWQIKKEQIK